MSDSTARSLEELSRASGSLRAPRSIVRTRRWLNANGDRAIAGLLVAPAVALLPVNEGRWYVIVLGGLVGALAVLLNRAVRSGRTTPWVSLFGGVGIAGATLLGDRLTFAALVMLTAYIAQVARTYGRKYALGNVTVGASILIAAGMLRSSVEASTLLLWFFAAVTTVGIIGEGSDRLASIATGLGLDIWDGAADGAKRHANVHPRDRHIIRYHHEQVSAGHDHELRYRIMEADRERWMLELVRVMGNRPQGVLIDITDRMEAEERLALYADLVESIGLGLILVEQQTDQSLWVRAANPAVTSIAGEGRESAFALTFESELRKVIAEGVTIEIGPTRLPGDHSRFVRLRAFPIGGYMAALTVEDATAWHLATAALEAQAANDQVTGLANRNGLRRELNDIFLKDPAATVALFHADLDDFRDINESLGHASGDRVLAAIARRLTVGLPDARLISRLGGDDFAILFVGEAHVHRAGDIAEQICDLLSQEVKLDGMRLAISAAVGIATTPHDANDPGDLVSRAERAMYAAKRSAMRVAYHDDDEADSARRMQLIADFPAGFDSEQFNTHYQPVIDLRDGVVVGAETLVRWKHPEHGTLMPNEFVSIADLAGYGGALSLAVAEHAIADGAQWFRDGLDLFVTVNLSASSLADTAVADQIGELLTEHGLPPERLRIEITEAAVVDDLFNSVNTLAALRARGSEVSIDDFGIGYSSLSLLKKLPLDEIKIDRSVLSDLETRDVTLVRAVIDLAHALGLRVVAEGVEHTLVFEQLVGLGCDRAQGFLFGRPMPAAEFVALVKKAPPALEIHLGWLRAVTNRSSAGLAKVTPLAGHRAKARRAE